MSLCGYAASLLRAERHGGRLHAVESNVDRRSSWSHAALALVALVVIVAAAAALVILQSDRSRGRRLQREQAEADAEMLAHAAQMYLALSSNCPTVGELLESGYLDRRRELEVSRCKVVCVGLDSDGVPQFVAACPERD